MAEVINITSRRRLQPAPKSSTWVAVSPKRAPRIIIEIIQPRQPAEAQ